MKYGLIFGLFGFLLFVSGLLYPYPFIEEKLNIPADTIEYIDSKVPFLFFIGIALLLVGIIKVIKSNTAIRFWSWKFWKWVSLIMLGISLTLSMLLFLTSSKITSEELASLETTYRWLIQMGGHVSSSNTYYEFIALTDIVPRVRVEVGLANDNLKRNTVDSELDSRSLSLNATEISDEDLARLKVLKHLRVLNLSDTKISDAGLIYLYDLKALRFLYLSNTRVSDVGIGKLKEALPRCEIKKL